MSALKTIIQDLINDRSEQAQGSIHSYFVEKMSSLTESVMDEKNFIVGGGKDWLESIGATKQDLEKAFTAAKKLPSYKALSKGLTDVTSSAEAKNGTFAFKKDGGEYKSKYRVYAHGQLRSASQQSNAGYAGAPGQKKEVGPTSAQQQYKMPSPKPTVIKGDVHKSIVTTYDNAFQALLKSAMKTGRIKEDADQLDEGKDSTNWKIMFHPNHEAYPEAQVNKLIKQLNKAGTATLVKSNAKDLVIQIQFNTPIDEDSVWDHVEKADLDSELDWGGSITAQRPKKV